MKIFVDENIPLMTVRALRELGQGVLDIRGTVHKGVADSTIWTMAQREGRLIITTDKGFAQHRGEAHYGILIVRLKQPTRRHIHERVMQAISRAEEEWPDLLVVMRDKAQSIWRLNDWR